MAFKRSGVRSPYPPFAAPPQIEQEREERREEAENPLTLHFLCSARGSFLLTTVRCPTSELKDLDFRPGPM